MEKIMIEILKASGNIESVLEFGILCLTMGITGAISFIFVLKRFFPTREEFTSVVDNLKTQGENIKDIRDTLHTINERIIKITTKAEYYDEFIGVFVNEKGK